MGLQAQPGRVQALPAHTKRAWNRTIIRSGVYTIYNKLSNKYYIGESKNVHVRLRLHKADLLRNDHRNIHLQRAFNRDGLEAFEFSILDECSIHLCKAMENYWCNILNTHNPNYGYNIRGTTDEEKQGKISEQSRKRMSLAKLGKKLPLEHRLKLSEAQKKRGGEQYRSPEGISNIRRANVARSKPVLQHDSDGNFIKEWPSRVDAATTLKIGVSGICNVTLGLRKTAGGYIWKFKN